MYKRQGHIRAAYGCSLGGSFVGLLAARRNIHMDYGILGSSDLDQASPLAAKLQTDFLLPLIYPVAVSYTHLDVYKRQTYGSGETAVHALKDVSFSVPKGEYVAVVGESGSGKSTLLNLIGGLDTPTSGKVLIDGKDVFAMKDRELTIFRRRNIGFIFQAFNLIPELTVEQNLSLIHICSTVRTRKLPMTMWTWIFPALL